jgi:protein-tyrosine phosphatase
LIDLHFHCLPRIDDGPASWDEAVALCRLAAKEGTKKIVATPHVFRDPWINSNPVVRGRLVAALNSRLKGSPRVVAGCEYLFSDQVISLIQRRGATPLTGLGEGAYLLIEFDPGHVPSRTAALFHEIQVLGVHPVIAHPERNLVFAREPRRLAELVHRGAAVQITAASLLGEFGRTARKACDDFFRMGIVHVVASDAHSLRSRPPRLAAAYTTVRAEWGEEAALGLFGRNPRAILKSLPLPYAPS